jgi:uncharacterized membrane protein HdeD (DUF308 family)
MLISPSPSSRFGYKLSRDAAEQLSRNWWIVLLDGLLLILAGILIFSIDWDTRSLATFIGALFILEGLAVALTGGFNKTTQRTNVIFGLLSIAAGVAIIVWPSPGLTAVAVFLGAWLIVVGTTTIVGSFAARDVIPNWWLWLIVGLLEVPLGVLALADPGATLAAIITVGGIWAVAVGVMRVVLSFEIKRLPHEVDKAFGATDDDKRTTKTETKTDGAAKANGVSTPNGSAVHAAS